MMAAKLGLVLTEQNQQQVLNLAIDLEKLLTLLQADMTIFYRKLAHLPDDQSQWQDYLQPCFYQDHSQDNRDHDTFQALITWLTSYVALRDEGNEDRQQIITRMNAVNPKYVLRNYLAQQAIELAEQGDYSMIAQLQQVLRQPYDEQPAFEHFAEKRPDWAKNKPGCSMLSCSS